MIVPSDHVRDSELEIVGDRSELVRRGPIRSHESRAPAHQTHGTLVVALGRAGVESALRGRRVEMTSLALAHGAFVE